MDHSDDGSIVASLRARLAAGPLARLEAAIGAQPASLERAVAFALPELVAALARQVDRGGAGALSAALDRDHDGSVLDDLPGLFSRGRCASGERILGHVLGPRRAALERVIASRSDTDAGTVGRVLPLLAPALLGMVGRAKRDAGLGASGLVELLRREVSGPAGPGAP